MDDSCEIMMKCKKWLLRPAPPGVEGMWCDIPDWLLEPPPQDGTINKEICTLEVSLFWDTNMIICNITTWEWFFT